MLLFYVKGFAIFARKYIGNKQNEIICKTNFKN